MFKILNISVHSKFELDFKSLFSLLERVELRFLCPLFLYAVICWSDFCMSIFRNGFQHLTHVISLNANCSYLSVILYDPMKGCVVLKVIWLILHFWLRERESPELNYPALSCLSVKFSFSCAVLAQYAEDADYCRGACRHCCERAAYIFSFSPAF